MDLNEKQIIENVVSKLLAEGVLKDAPSAKNAATEGMKNAHAEAPLELPSLKDVAIDNAHNKEALSVMRKSTPARVLMGRAGTRQKWHAYLNFLADHAAALDAVFMDVSDECLEKANLFRVQTVVKDKDEYLMRPDLGKKLSEEAKKTILEKCEKGVQVQIIVADGLSSTSIEANVEDTLPALMQGLKAEGIRVGVPFFVKYARVGIQDEIGQLLDCDVVVEFVGERPGLITAESMSSYMIYRPGADTVEADRTVISNIHKGGTPPAEAGAHMATVIRQMLAHKASGVTLSEKLKG